MSKVFKVSFSYTVYGNALHVEADTPEEAAAWLLEEIRQNGIAEFEHELFDMDATTGDVVEEVK